MGGPAQPLPLNFLIMIILVTGASAGIGRATAEHLAGRGHKVYGFSRSEVDTIHFISMQVDVTQPQQIKKAVDSILSAESRIDVLINNAGMGMVGAVEDSAPAEIEKLFHLNLVGAVQMMQAVLPGMRAQRKGKIINISSIGSEMGLPFRGFYSASKAALDKVTEALRYEICPWNVEACVVHLGDIKTRIADHRVQATVSSPYEKTFHRVHELMNRHVDSGTETLEVAVYLEKLISGKKLKAHYYFGKFGQKIGIPLKWLLPQNWYEALMKKYNGLS